MADSNVVAGIFKQMISIILPALGICMLTTGITNCGQIGFLLTFETVKPDLKNLIPRKNSSKFLLKKPI
jgi:flagellar biosynthesis protein FlhB